MNSDPVITYAILCFATDIHSSCDLADKERVTAPNNVID